MALKEEHSWLWVHNMYDGLDRVTACHALAKRTGFLNDECIEVINAAKHIHQDWLDRIIEYDISLPEGYSMDRIKEARTRSKFDWENDPEQYKKYVAFFCGRD